MHYLIFGDGYFGRKCAALLPDAHVERVDITDAVAVRAALVTHKPKVVINAAGKTGRPNVDWCEEHRLETLDANVRGPLTLLRVCAELGQYWVQMGSGCIYEGDKNGEGWHEEDVPTFTGSYYSKTKAWMNDMLRDHPVLQVRLRMPLDEVPGPRNLITKLVSYSQVISVPNSISVVEDAVRTIGALAERRAVGIYNLVNPGVITHKEILDMYREIVDPAHQATYISLQDLASLTKAPRSNCVLSTEKLQREGIVLPEIHARVREILTVYKEKLTT